MFEEKTQDTILAAMLDNAAEISDIEITEGGFVSNALSVAAMAIEDAYQDAEEVMANALPDSCDREHLIRFAEARGMAPYAATTAKFTVACNVELPVGFRLTNGELNFSVTEAGETTEIQCETVGPEGNAPTVGEPLDAIDYIDGFESCVITAQTARGAEEEDTESFRTRYLAAMDVSGQFGNAAFYQDLAQGVDGVGRVWVAYADDTVYIYFWADGDAMPTEAQAAEVQAAAEAAAPLGHAVTVERPVLLPLNMAVFDIAPAAENTEANQTKIQQYINDYFMMDRVHLGQARKLYWNRLTAYVISRLEQDGTGITSLKINSSPSSTSTEYTLYNSVFLTAGTIQYTAAS